MRIKLLFFLSCLFLINSLFGSDELYQELTTETLQQLKQEVFDFRAELAKPQNAKKLQLIRALIKSWREKHIIIDDDELKRKQFESLDTLSIDSYRLCSVCGDCLSRLKLEGIFFNDQNLHKVICSFLAKGIQDLNQQWTENGVDFSKLDREEKKRTEFSQHRELIVPRMRDVITVFNRFEPEACRILESDTFNESLKADAIMLWELHLKAFFCTVDFWHKHKLAKEKLFLSEENFYNMFHLVNDAYLYLRFTHNCLTAFLDQTPTFPIGRMIAEFKQEFNLLECSEMLALETDLRSKIDNVQKSAFGNVKAQMRQEYTQKKQLALDKQRALEQQLLMLQENFAWLPFEEIYKRLSLLKEQVCERKTIKKLRCLDNFNIQATEQCKVALQKDLDKNSPAYIQEHGQHADNLLKEAWRSMVCTSWIMAKYNRLLDKPQQLNVATSQKRVSGVMPQLSETIEEERNGKLLSVRQNDPYGIKVLEELPPIEQHVVGMWSHREPLPKFRTREQPMVFEEIKYF